MHLSWRLLILNLFVYNIVAISFFPSLKYYLNIDGISYLTIAKKYWAGDIEHAINGLWSPLICWLLAPLSTLDGELLFHFKAMNIFIGNFVLIALYFLLKQLKIPPAWIGLGLFICIPRITQYSLMAYPDLLMILLLLLYLSLLIRHDFLQKKLGIWLGLIAGIGYLSKAYFFHYFLATITIAFLIHVHRSTWKKQLASYSLSIGVFLLLALPWIITISHKYQMWTVSTAAAYNFSLKKTPSKAYAHPVIYEGLFVPPNSTAVNAWEDNSLYLKDTRSFAHLADIGKSIKRTVNNFFVALVFFNRENFMGYTTLALALFIILWRGLGLSFWRSSPIHQLILFSLIYLGGYLLIMIEDRYLWFLHFVSLIIAILLLKQASSHFGQQKPMATYGMAFLFFIGFATLPCKNLVWNQYQDKKAYLLAQELKAQGITQQRMASHANWRTLIMTSYFADLQYLGQTSIAYSDTAQVSDALQKTKAQLFFTRTPEKSLFLQGWKKLGVIGGFHIYKKQE